MRMGITKKVKSYESYIADKISNRSVAVQEQTQRVLGQFDSFCVDNYKKSRDLIIKESLELDIESQEDIITEIAQKWINHLNLVRKIKKNTIDNYVSILKKYLKYYRIQIDFKEELEYPELLQEERYAITLKEIQQIIDNSKWKKKGYYLSLISSGSRPIEILGLRKKDYEFTGKRFMALIPAKLTKKKIARTVFFSIEVNQYLHRLLKEKKDNDLVWTDNENIHNVRRSEATLFQRVCSRIGLDKRYDSTGYHKVNMYCFRGYFFTNALNVVNSDIAHSFIGHSAYLQTYQRRGIKDKERIYEKIEPEILISDTTRKDKIIEDNQDINSKLEQMEEKLKRQDDENKLLFRLLGNVRNATEEEIKKYNL